MSKFKATKDNGGGGNGNKGASSGLYDLAFGFGGGGGGGPTTPDDADIASRKILSARRKSGTATATVSFASASMSHHHVLKIVDLPDCVMEDVLKYISFDQISQMRVVCRRFDQVCGYQLNQGFRDAKRFHAKFEKEVKDKLPRRDSKRRKHPLGRHYDILTSLGDTISWLSWTFMQFVDVDKCCFIPGKVIDEIFKILGSIQQDKEISMNYEVLQELRDISYMAIEYFKEKIVPTLRRRSRSHQVSPKFQSPAAYLSSLPAILASSSASADTPMRPGLSSLMAEGSAGGGGGGGAGTSAGNGIGFKEKIEMRLAAMEKRNKKASVEGKKQMKEMKQALNDQSSKIINMENVIASQESKFAKLSKELINRDPSLKDVLQKFESKFEGEGSDRSHLKRAASANAATGKVAKKRARVCRKI